MGRLLERFLNWKEKEKKKRLHLNHTCFRQCFLPSPMETGPNYLSQRLLGNLLTGKSLVTIPEVFAKVNSPQFPSLSLFRHATSWGGALGNEKKRLRGRLPSQTLPKAQGFQPVGIIATKYMLAICLMQRRLQMWFYWALLPSKQKIIAPVYIAPQLI